MRRTVRSLLVTSLLAVIASSAAALATTSGPATATPSATRLPDLGKARLRDLQIQTTTSGRRLLRFTSTIVNVGAGPFEVRGRRPSTSTATMTTQQRLYTATGGHVDVDTPAVMFYAGDGHNHWHVKDLERSDLIRLDNGVKVAAGAKIGFCFYDTNAYRLSLPGAPSSPVYTGCGTSTSLKVRMGLSVGWGDRYAWNLAYQYVDITRVPPGRYRLLVTVDAAQWFVETLESNNATWVDLELTTTGGLRILAYGPAA